MWESSEFSMQLAGKLTAALRSFPLNVKQMYTRSSHLEEGDEHLEDDRKKSASGSQS